MRSPGSPMSRSSEGAESGAACRLPSVRLSRPHAPVAQLDRALPSEGRGQGFESLRARHTPGLRQHPETTVVVAALPQNSPTPPVPSSRPWLAPRPDGEHGELIGGVAMMMPPPNRRHQRIAYNLVSLLDTALKR